MEDAEKGDLESRDNEEGRSTSLEPTGRFSGESRTCPRAQTHATFQINQDSNEVSLGECHCVSCRSRELSLLLFGSDNSDDEYSSDSVAQAGGISEEEDFENKTTSKANRKLGKRVRPKYLRKSLKKKTTKEEKKDLKPREARRREIRKLAKEEERLARVELWERLRQEAHQAASQEEEQGGMLYQELLEHADAQMLTAQELGVQDEDMYERLMEIAVDGDDITPEDFDLLLLLDSKNHKTTLKESDICQFDTWVVGKTSPEEEKSLHQCSSCLICLEVFEKLPQGTELRRLPCKHVFCKTCIDEWLQQNSVKCPNLSCFWKPSQQEKEETPKEEDVKSNQHEV